MKLLILSIFSIFCAVFAHSGHYGMDHLPPDTVVCTVTAKKLFINGYYVRELEGAELEEFNKYMDKVQEFKDKVQEITKRREREDFHMMKISHRFRRDAKFEDTPSTALDAKPVETKEDKSDLPSPPEKPSFCQKPSMPVVFGGGCVVIHKKVYIHDQPVRDLTDDEAVQVEKYQKEQEEYVEKWRQVMGMRMQLYGPQAHPNFGRRRGGPMGGGMMGNQRQQPSQEQEQQQENEEQQQGPNMQGSQMNGPMFGGMGMGGPMGRGPMDNMPEMDLELPKEPEPPKICAVIF